jgi:hypothetical protein
MQLFLPIMRKSNIQDSNRENELEALMICRHFLTFNICFIMWSLSVCYLPQNLYAFLSLPCILDANPPTMCDLIILMIFCNEYRPWSLLSFSWGPASNWTVCGGLTAVLLETQVFQDTTLCPSTAWPWRWRHNELLQLREPCTYWCSVISQETWVFNLGFN